MANMSLSADTSEAKPRYWRRLIIGLVVVIVLIAVIAAGKVGLVMKQMSSFKPPTPPTVTTTEATMQDWSNKFDTVGSLRAWRGTDLSTEIAGLVRSVHFRSGQSVAEGEVLVELNADAGGARPICEKLLACGLLAKETHDHTIRITPPLVLTQDQADWIARQFEMVL